MAWCHQTTVHYLCQYWPRSMSLYGVTRPQWVMDHFVYAPSQWEMTLHCNVASHWLGTYTKWSLWVKVWWLFSIPLIFQQIAWFRLNISFFTAYCINYAHGIVFLCFGLYRQFLEDLYHLFTRIIVGCFIGTGTIVWNGAVKTTSLVLSKHKWKCCL